MDKDNFPEQAVKMEFGKYYVAEVSFNDNNPITMEHNMITREQFEEVQKLFELRDTLAGLVNEKSTLVITTDSRSPSPPAHRIYADETVEKDSNWVWVELNPLLSKQIKGAIDAGLQLIDKRLGELGVQA